MCVCVCDDRHVPSPTNHRVYTTTRLSLSYNVSRISVMHWLRSPLILTIYLYCLL